MNNSLIKDTFREIRKTKGRFFSIFAIVAIGTAFFAGVCATGDVMRLNADKYFDDENLMDYRIMSNFGITDEDIKAIEKVDGVKAVMPAYEADVFVSIDTTQTVMRIHSLDLNHLGDDDDEYMNHLIVTQGRLPQKSGEIVVEEGKLVSNSLSVGQEITISSGTGDDILDTFKKNKYTIVGKVKSSYYLSYQKGSSSIGSGSVSVFAYIPKEDFALDIFTEAFVTVDGAKDFNSFKGEYFDYIEPVTDKLEELGVRRSDIRRREILDRAQEKYDDAHREYEKGKEEFESQIAAAEKKLDDGEKEIFQNEIKLSTSKSMAEMQFTSAQQQIDTNKATLQTYKEQLKTRQEAYDKALESVAPYRQEAQDNLNSAKADQREKQQTYNEKKAVYDDLYNKNEIYVNRKNENVELNRKISADQILLNITTDEAQKAEIQRRIAENQEKVNANNEIIARIDSENPNLSADLSTTQTELALAQAELEQANQSVENYQKALDTIDRGLSGSKSALDQINKQIADREKQISDGETQLANAKRQASAQFADGEKQIAAAKVTLEKGKKELEEKKADGQQQLDDAYNQLVEAQAQIDGIAQAKWYILDRNSHYSYVDYNGASERIDAISKVFPVFFLLVAMLVCLTTMTRMVDEERTQIGTLKALGYRTSQIAFKYVFYAASASFVGSIAGLRFGTVAFPFIIYTAWNMMYTLPAMKIYFVPGLMVLSAIVSVAVTTGAAFAACYKELVETPSVLMRPKTPKMGKKILLEHIGFIWNKMSFTSKVTARNIFRYKKRFLMTVIGIRGCTALLIAGFGIKDSISQLVSTQFEEIFRYQGVASLSDDLTRSEKEALVEKLQNSAELEGVCGVNYQSATATNNDDSIDITLCVITDSDNFEDYVDLHNRKTGEKIAVKTSGAVISEHTANKLGISVGDEIDITNSSGMTRKVKISDICENYVGHYIYMTTAGYRNAFDLQVKSNSLLIKVADEYKHDDSKAAKLLTEQKGVDTVSFYTATVDNFDSMISSLNYIVIVLVISAGALAFVVLYNLTNVNISERLREIATLKVLGFREKEVNSYVYRENIILTFIGSLAGLLLGKVLHLAIMVMVELDTVMFGRIIQPYSYVVSLIITMLFAFIVNFAMKNKLRDIPMVESLKSVE